MGMKKFMAIQFAQGVPECGRTEHDTMESAIDEATDRLSYAGSEPVYIFELRGCVETKFRPV